MKLSKIGEFEHQYWNEIPDHISMADEVLFYHSQEGNCIMCRVNVIEEAHQDKTIVDPKWMLVTFEPVVLFLTKLLSAISRLSCQFWD